MPLRVDVHGPAVEEVLVDPVGKQQPPFRALPQAVVDLCRRVVVADTDPVDVHIFQYMLGIPAEEAEDPSWCSPAPSIPVVMRPVVVAGVEVHQHVIGDIEHVEMLLEGVVV